MDMTRFWIMSAAAEQSRPFLIEYNDTVNPDLSPKIWLLLGDYISQPA
jgi:hypothetical protein